MPGFSFWAARRRARRRIGLAGARRGVPKDLWSIPKDLLSSLIILMTISSWEICQQCGLEVFLHRIGLLCSLIGHDNWRTD